MGVVDQSSKETYVHALAYFLCNITLVCLFLFLQKCGRFESCKKLGLHSHHPRDCLYFLRDFSVPDLQQILTKNNVEFDTGIHTYIHTVYYIGTGIQVYIQCTIVASMFNF